MPTTVNTRDLMLPHVHGRHAKDVVVLHETVSSDLAGLGDILAVATDLARRDYGIHGITDAEGNEAWAEGLGNAVFWQAGGVNERSIGIEQVSKVMLQSPSNVIRRKIWAARSAQLRATARRLAKIHHDWPDVPLVYSDGDHPGVTTHWHVSQHHPESEGHTDCWPIHMGGYYPALEVIQMARVYAKL